MAAGNITGVVFVKSISKGSWLEKVFQYLADHKKHCEPTSQPELDARKMGVRQVTVLLDCMQSVFFFSRIDR